MKTPLGFLFLAKEFNKYEKKQKLTKKFGMGFKELDQNFEISVEGLFFYISTENLKTNSNITKQFLILIPVKPLKILLDLQNI